MSTAIVNDQIVSLAASKLTGTVGVANGGTNLASYAIGDLLYATGATTLAKLADVAVGSVLVSGGIGVAPAWGSAPALTIVDDTTTNATMFPVWVTAATGSLPLKVSSTKLSFNPSTGGLSLTGVLSLVATGVSGPGRISMDSFDRNVYIGKFAGDVNTTGNQNVGIGESALALNTTGAVNVAVGRQSMRSNTEGANNTAIGVEALQGNTSGGNNTAIGYGAITAGATSSNNVGIGMQALQFTTGTLNAALGWRALQASLGAANNVAVGAQAMLLNTDGSNSVAVGALALSTNLTGNNNVAIGFEALKTNTSSSGTAVGHSALKANTSGGANTAVGLSALAVNTDGDDNAAVGALALGLNTQGDQNAAVGRQALYGNTTGDNNTAIGFEAGAFITGGVTANQTSGTSVYLGTQTRASASGNANEIVIGYQATGGGSNTATLGNASIVTTILRGNVTATTFTGALVGNASTATSAATLTTPRAINGVDFDGSAAITVTAAAGTLTGTVLNATVVTSSLTAVGALATGSITTGFGTIVTANKVAIGAAAVDATSMLLVGSAGEAQSTIWSDTGGVSADTDAFLRFVIDAGKTLKGLMGYDQGLDRFILGYNGTSGLRIDSSGNLEIPVNLSKYRAITTAGWGVPAIYGSGRSVAQVAAVASVAAYTLTAADASFLIGANVNVTTSTLHNFTVTVSYTDEGNTARTLTLTFSQLTGALVTAITNVTGAGPYEGIAMQIRCKASTAITVATVGTFTTLVYNVEAVIQQVS